MAHSTIKQGQIFQRRNQPSLCPAAQLLHAASSKQRRAAQRCARSGQRSDSHTPFLPQLPCDRKWANFEHKLDTEHSKKQKLILFCFSSNMRGNCRLVFVDYN